MWHSAQRSECLFILWLQFIQIVWNFRIRSQRNGTNSYRAVLFNCGGFCVQKGMHVATQNFLYKIQPPLMVEVNCIDKSSIHSNEASLTQPAALQSTKRLLLLCKSIWSEWMVVRCTQNWNGNASQSSIHALVYGVDSHADFAFSILLRFLAVERFHWHLLSQRVCAVLCSTHIYVSLCGMDMCVCVWLWINSRDVNRI